LTEQGKQHQRQKHEGPRTLSKSLRNYRPNPFRNTRPKSSESAGEANLPPYAWYLALGGRELPVWMTPT
jgi:hypothetical protein